MQVSTAAELDALAAELAEAEWLGADPADAHHAPSDAWYFELKLVALGVMLGAGLYFTVLR